MTDVHAEKAKIKRIMAIAQELRYRMQSGKELMPWDQLPVSRKQKWIRYARLLYAAMERVDD